VEINEGLNQVDFRYDTYIYTSDTRGDIHADVLISLQEERYYVEVNTYSYSEEGEPVDHVVEFEVNFVSGPNTLYTLDADNRLFVEDVTNIKPAAMIRPSTLTEYSFEYEGGNVVATTDGTESLNFFRLYFYDYIGCPAEGELFNLHDAGDLLTVGNEFLECEPVDLDLTNIEGMWFSMDWTDFPSLYHVNKTNGQLTRIAQATESFEEFGNIAGMEVDADNKKAYFITFRWGQLVDEGESLWEVDIATGEFTKIMTVEGIHRVTALDLRPNGNLWFAADLREGVETRPIGYIELDTLNVVVVSEETQYPAELGENPENFIRFSSLATAPSGEFYGTDYDQRLFKFDGTQWNFVRSLGELQVYAADFDVNGLLMYQLWDGEVNSIDIDTLEVTNLWPNYTFAPPYEGEGFAVATGIDLTVQVDTFGGELIQSTGSNPPPMSVDPITAPTVNGITGFNAGNVINVTGKGLDGMTKLIVGGIEIPFTNNTATGFTFTAPAGLAPGIYDLVLTATNGTLSYQRAVLIAGKEGAIVADGDSQTLKKTFSGYAAGRSVLTAEMKSQIRQWLNQNPQSEITFRVTGLTMGPSVLPGDKKLALARAKAAVAYIKSLRPNAKFASERSENQTKVGAQNRSVRIELSYGK
ncbi:MAG: hypothetical protein RIS09_1283, partial [Actinomycetota bacterium]